MGKSSPSGNTTVTQLNPVQQAQQPFLNDLWSQGQVLNMVENNPALYPGVSQLQGYAQNLFNTTGGPASALMPPALAGMANLYSQGVPSAGAQGALGALAPQLSNMAQGYGANIAGFANAMPGIMQGYTNPMTGYAQGLAQYLPGLGQNVSDASNAAAGQMGNWAAGAGGQAQLGNQYAAGAAGYAPQMANFANQATGYAPGMAGFAGQMGGTAGGLNALSGQLGAYTPTLSSAALQGLTGLGGSAVSGLSGLSDQAQQALSPYAQGANMFGQSYGGQALTAGQPSQAALMGLSGMAVQGNPIYNSLTGMASGQYINPSTNPALQGTISAATDPLVRQFQTATAPGIDSAMEAAGRYGSGAAGNAQDIAQRNLGTALSNTTSQIVNNAYNTGLQATLGAGQALGSAYNTGVANAGNLATAAGQLGQAGVSNAANITNQGLATGGNLTQAQLALQNQALGNAYSIGGGLTGQGYNLGANILNQGFAGAGNLGAQAGALYGGGASALGQAGQLYNQAGGLYGTAGGLYNQAGQIANQGGNINLGAGTLAGQAGQLGAGGYQNQAAILQAALAGAGGLYGSAGQLTGNTLAQAMSGLGTGGGLANQGMIGAGNLYSSLGGLANTGTMNLASMYGAAPQFANYPETQMTSAINAPWLPMQNYAGLLGNPQGGSSTTQQPYFNNPLANALGTGLGGLGLYNGLNTATGGGLSSGLGSLFGGAGAALPAADYFTPIAGTLGGISDFAGGADFAGSALAALAVV